jgi:hypothetical protein
VIEVFLELGFRNLAPYHFHFRKILAKMMYQSMPKHFVVCGIFLLIASPACSKRETPPSPAESQQATAALSGPGIDACALLTTEEVQSIQGEPIKETKPSGKSDGGLTVSQCYFTLPTFTNSISLRIVQKSSGPGGRDPKQVWDETFAPDKLQDIEREGGGKKLAPQRIADVGDAAFWIGSPAGGLYVLKGNRYIRVSVGGGVDDQETRIKKCTALAEKILKHL